MDTSPRVVVTGHSRGIGAALAEHLRARQIPVLGLARPPHRGLAGDPGLIQVGIDLAEAKGLAAWLATPALTNFLRDAPLAVLVNNAGVVTPVGPPGRQGAEAVARAVAVNLTAALVLSDAFVAATEGRARRIVHMSSGAARSPYAGWSVYCATKAALDMHARAVRLDAPAGLAIVSMAPGVVDTAMQQQLRETPLADFPQRPRFEQLKADAALAEPASVADRLVDWIFSAEFGREAVGDLRTLTAAPASSPQARSP